MPKSSGEIEGFRGMSGAYPSHSAGAVLDADAVCEVCGNVNPEGTLICRTCGNNLRDQKARRLAAEVQMLEPDGIQGIQIFRGALVLFGLLLIGWVAINVNQIADALIGAGGASDPLNALFESSDAAVYDAMLVEAQALMPSYEQMEALRAAPLPGNGADGNYVLVRIDDYSGPEIVGTAIARSDVGGMRFVAALGGGAHIRGTALGQGASAFRADWDTAAARDPEGRTYAVTGVAVVQLDGSVECFGQSAAEEPTSYEVVAYRLP